MAEPVPSRVAALLDVFVPAQIRERTDEAPVRARTGVGIALVACAVFISLAGIRAASHQWGVALTNAVQAVLMIAFPLALRRTGRLGLLVNTFIGAITASFVVLVVRVFGAGLTMPALGLAIVPLLAVLLIGMRGGSAWLLTSSAALVGIGVLGALGRLPYRGTETLIAEHAALVVVAVLLYLIGGLYEYRKTLAASQIARLEETRHRAEHDRISALADAKISEAERLASLGELAAMAAHEINNPLSYVSNNLDYVARATRGGDRDVSDALAEARDGVQRIQRIVSDLQAHGRPGPEEPSIGDVARAVETALKTVEGHTRPRARVVTRIESVPNVIASQGRLVQVLLNLVINAAQAIPEGHADENEIAVFARVLDGRVAIDVSDTGPGIAKEILERVKEPFFTTKTGRGSGLGLTLCERILERFGGELQMKNGTRGAITRVLLLPVVDEVQPRTVTEPVQSSGRPGERLRILVVDDEPLVARALRRHLVEHDVRVVTSGREAVTLLESGAEFDRILCDMMMPDLTGMDVYEFVRNHRSELVDRVLFMTGGTFTARMREFRDTVTNPFLQKPVQLGELRALLR